MEAILTRDAELAKAHDLAHRFRKLHGERDLHGFHAWLAEAQASGLPSFVGVANGMLADREAVEGTIHKIKLLKRQGYGRCKLGLLRRRLRAG